MGQSIVHVLFSLVTRSCSSSFRPAVSTITPTRAPTAPPLTLRLLYKYTLRSHTSALTHCTSLLPLSNVAATSSRKPVPLPSRRSLHALHAHRMHLSRLPCVLI